MAKKNEMDIISLFSFPLIRVALDLDLEKLTKFVFEMRNKNKKGVRHTNRGGWHSVNIEEEPHEELKKLKKEIIQHLQMYHSKVFQGMEFKGNVVQPLSNMWVNINEKYHYNEWHVHQGSTLSGVYYIKHDGSREQGDIIFKHPNHQYISFGHWPVELVEKTNSVTSGIVNITPKSNMLLIFPSWMNHSVEANLNNDPRISVSFNSLLLPETT